MKKKQKGKTLWRLLSIVSLCLLVFSAYNLINLFMAYRAAKNEYKDLENIAHAPTEITDTYKSPIDFEALWEINTDIIGWIKIEGTVINYPIVQGETNNTYLRTTVRGEGNDAGSIFMDCRNSRDFSDKNTVIYGHKMQNGSMFADLAGYKKQNFYEEHPVVIIYTPEAEYRCEIFSAYITDSTSKTYTFGFADNATFEDFLSYTVEKSQISTGVNVSLSDSVITLSTCDYQFSDARMVVHARMTAAR